MSEKIKNIIGSKYSLKAVAVLTVFLALLLSFVFYHKMTTAYDKGQIDYYMGRQETLQGIQDILDTQLKPEKLELNYPEQRNSTGELHSSIIDGSNLGQFVYNNCSEEVRTVYKDVVAYSEERGIKPELVFAVTWADSQCGQKLTTPNNYGNVGNNDRGDKRGFMTPLAGFKAIIDTLNNKYISGLSKVGDLSQGGRTGTKLFTGTGAQYNCSEAPMPYKCYATSVENWHNNIMRALKVIGVQDVSAEWEFRG